MNRPQLASAFAALLITALPTATRAVEPALTVAAQSRSMIWNAVAIDHDRVFVAGPRWSGSTGPAVGLIDSEGQPVAYPDAAWNAWHPGDDASRSFVDVNAIHLDGKGGLWAVDTGSPEFGGDPLPGGAKLVQIDLGTNTVKRVIALGPDVALAGSYVDDIRFHDDFAYLTDAGCPGIIVVNLATGAMRRVLNNIPATRAPPDRPIVVDGQTVVGPDGKPLKVNTDPMEVSPDAVWFYFGTLEGPWSRIETRWLDDATASSETVNTQVQPWADLPPVGGTAMDANGDLYFSDLATSTLKCRSPDGQVTTVIHDPRLHWIDAPAIDDRHRIWLPVPQIDRAPPFHGGKSQIEWPVGLYHLPLSP